MAAMVTAKTSRSCIASYKLNILISAPTKKQHFKFHYGRPMRNLNVG